MPAFNQGLLFLNGPRLPWDRLSERQDAPLLGSASSPNRDFHPFRYRLEDTSDFYQVFPGSVFGVGPGRYPANATRVVIVRAVDLLFIHVLHVVDAPPPIPFFHPFGPQQQAGPIRRTIV